MFWFYVIILSSHTINGLLTGFARAILRNIGPQSFSTALASSGCTKTAVLYFSVWPSHPINKPLARKEDSVNKYIINGQEMREGQPSLKGFCDLDLNTDPDYK